MTEGVLELSSGGAAFLRRRECLTSPPPVTRTSATT